MCQALGIAPWHKYQTDGGPGVHGIVTKVLTNSMSPAADVREFMKAVAYNFIVAGTDAHAKNYALLVAAQGFRLAPLYDINSYVPYGLDERLTLSMSIGKRYKLLGILPRHWEQTAKSAGVDWAMVLGDIQELIARVPDEAQSTLAACRADGLKTAVLDVLAEGLATRCAGLTGY